MRSMCRTLALVATAATVATLGLPATARAQCTIAVTGGGSTSGGHTAHGQSFTACATGSVTTIEIEYTGGAVAGLTLNIFNGNTVSGAPAHTQTGIALAGGPGFKLIAVTPPFPVTAGQQFTFNINVLSPVTFDIEPGGSPESSYFSNGEFTGLALNHRVTILGAVPALPAAWTTLLALLLLAAALVARRLHHPPLG